MFNPFKNPNIINKLITSRTQFNNTRNYSSSSIFKGMQTGEIMAGPVALSVSCACLGPLLVSDFSYDKMKFSTALPSSIIGGITGICIGSIPILGTLLGVIILPHTFLVAIISIKDNSIKKDEV